MRETSCNCHAAKKVNGYSVPAAFTAAGDNSLQNARGGEITTAERFTIDVRSNINILSILVVFFFFFF